MLSYQAARAKVIEVASRCSPSRSTERIDIRAALGRVLADEVKADRDYPPFHRSLRDGFALCAANVPEGQARLKVIGEVKAGEGFDGSVPAGCCVQIMTGAPVPSGTDAVVMLELVQREADEIVMQRSLHRGDNIVWSASECRKGETLLRPGTRLGYAEMALAAQVGRAQISVYAQPRVAILSTGDEVVDIAQQPGPFQIRNSNSLSLVAQTSLAGAIAVPLGNAPDQTDPLRERIEQGLRQDILILSGGVSMGKYDLVEAVLAALGAEFLFDAVAIRPGRPAVFGVCGGKLVFGLPGNPVSTMVTFELLVAPAIEVCAGMAARPLALFGARLKCDVSEKPPLAHFVPAAVSWESGEPVVRQLPWQGSGDIVTLAKANCFLVVPPERLRMAAGEWAQVLPRRGYF